MSRSKSWENFNLLSIISFVFSIFPVFFVITFLYSQQHYNDTYTVYHHIVISVAVFLGVIIGITALKKIKRTKERGNTIAVFAITFSIVFLFIFSMLILGFKDARDAGFGRKDARRVSNIKQIQTALELYHDDAGRFPEKLNFGERLEYNGETYMGVVPTTVLPNNGFCPEDFRNKYTSTKNGQSYKLEYCLGDDTGGISGGYHVATPSGMADP